MVRERIHGSDTEFCAWLRQQGNSYLPSSEWVATDNDCTIHRYKFNVDKIGTREIQALMHLEVKTRGGKPSMSQQDTLYKKHITTTNALKVGKEYIRNFGVTILSLHGTDPDNSDHIEWGRFRKPGSNKVFYSKISKVELLELLRFDRHPDNFTRQTFRRHHLTGEIIIEEVQPLGFVCERVVVHRS